MSSILSALYTFIKYIIKIPTGIKYIKNGINPVLINNDIESWLRVKKYSLLIIKTDVNTSEKIAEIIVTFLPFML